MHCPSASSYIVVVVVVFVVNSIMRNLHRVKHKYKVSTNLLEIYEYQMLAYQKM